MIIDNVVMALSWDRGMGYLIIKSKNVKILLNKLFNVCFTR